MSQKPKPTLQHTDDDDLDDLDDVLAQFNPVKPKAGGSQPIPPGSPLTSPPPPPPTATTKTSFGRPRTNTRVDAPPKSLPDGGPADLNPTDEVDEDALTADFARELAKGMESLMAELSTVEPGQSDTAEPSEEEKAAAQKAFAAAWERMLVEGMDGMTGGVEEPVGDGGLGATSSPKADGSKPESDFAKKIRETMQHLKQSESNLQGSQGGTSSASAPDPLVSFLSSIAGGGESEEELAGMLETMMGQLMSKEILYDPLKELAEKYPPYLANPPESISPEDKKRFESQLVCVRKILTVFDQPDYKDDDLVGDSGNSKQIVELMSEMQSFGSPPEAVMGPLPPGLGFGPDGGVPEGCVVT